MNNWKLWAGLAFILFSIAYAAKEGSKHSALDLGKPRPLHEEGK